MIPPGRIIVCLSLAVVALAATCIFLALRLTPTSAVVSAPAPAVSTPIDAAELRRLGASIEAHGVQMVQLRELLQAGGQGGANAVGNPRELAALRERVEQTERNVQEILRIMRQIETLVASVGPGRNGGWTSYAPAAPTPTPADALSQRRNLATGIKNDLRLIDAAIDQYAIEFNTPTGTPLTFPQLKLYF